MVLGLAFVFTGFALLPLAYVAFYAIDTGWNEAWALVMRARVAELLWNTVRLLVATTLCAMTLGVVCAWAVERTNVSFKRVWSVLLVAPLAVPAFVNSYGWASVLPGAEGFGAALLIVTLSYFPLVYLPVAATLRGLDPATEDVARSLGFSEVKVFLRVVLPQLRPAVLGGALLVGLHLIAEFGALQLLRFPTFTTAIYDQYQSSFNSPAANMLAAVLVVLSMLLLVGELRLQGHRRYARVGSGAARRASVHELGRARVPVVIALVVLCVLSIGVPVFSTVRWLVVGSSASVDWQSLWAATISSIGLGLVGALATTVAVFPVAWLVVRHRSPLVTLLERCTYLANALPGIVVALALVTIGVRYASPLYQSVIMLVVAYGVMFMPRALVSTRAALAQAPPVLDDVARSTGASPLKTLVKVTLPLAAPGVGAGAALVFLAIVTELTATLLLSPIGTSTLATEFWSNSSAIAYGAAAPYALMMMVISLPATLLLVRSIDRIEGVEP